MTVKPPIIKGKTCFKGTLQTLAFFTPFHRKVLHALFGVSPYIKGVMKEKVNHQLIKLSNAQLHKVHYTHDNIKQTTELLLISDIHSDKENAFEKSHLASVLDYAKKMNPQAILLLGDIVHKQGFMNDYLNTFFAQIQSIAPVRYIWGNHDHYPHVDINRIQNQLHEINIQSIYQSPLLINNISIAGYDYEQFMSFEEQKKHLDVFNKYTFNMLMVHNPDLLDSRHAQHLEQVGIDAMVHGHTHWGEIAYVGIIRPMLANGYWHLNKHMAKSKMLLNHLEKPLLSINNRGSNVALERILTTSFEPTHPWVKKAHASLVQLFQLISFPRMFTHLTLEPKAK